MTDIKILYKDKHLVIAVKPAGVLSQPDRTGDAAMTDILAEKVGVEVFPVHRLDRTVGGVMVYALTKEAAGKLSAIVGSDSFRKEYLTIVNGVPTEKKGELFDFLLHDPRKNMTFVVPRTTKDAKEAKLSYEVLEQKENSALVRVLLHTGRTHQIRVQFSSRGMSILGDGKYGSRERHGVALWSHRLSFVHPITKKRLSYSAIPEMETPWDQFSEYGVVN